MLVTSRYVTLARRVAQLSVIASCLACGEKNDTVGPGSGGAAGGGGIGGASGAPTGGTGGAAGCMDIHVISDMLPKGALEFVPGSVGQMERETLWRDEHGLHFAWNPWITDGSKGGEGTGLRLVISTFDAGTGDVIGHRVFPEFGLGSVVRSPNGIVCVGAGRLQGSTVTTGALLLDQKDPKVQTFVPIYSGTVSVPHVGWDGEAFALHFWGTTGLEVSRVSEAGDVLLPPVVFGQSYGFLPDLRLSTDAVSGVSFAVSGQLEKVPWIAAHTRDGKPVPGTEAQGGRILPVQGDLGTATGVAFHTVRGVPGGALVAWSLASGSPDAMVVVQSIDASLAATGDVVLVKPTQYQGANEEKDWLTIQQEPEGWWVGASGPTFLESVRKSTGGVVVENLSSYELMRSGEKIMDLRHLGSTRYGDELWLGFEDETAGDSLGKVHTPYRIVRLLPGCVYPSMWDLANQK
jgi:hypothetical protein